MVVFRFVASLRRALVFGVSTPKSTHSIRLIMQSESLPVSLDQLAAEVEGIYGGLVMVEAM